MTPCNRCRRTACDFAARACINPACELRGHPAPETGSALDPLPIAPPGAEPVHHHSEDVVAVPLSRGLHAIVDAADAQRVLAIKWHARPQHRAARGAGFYAVNGRGGAQPTRAGIRYLHRFVLGAPDDALVDHINGNGLDCRRANLRLATASLNTFNRPYPRRDLPRGVYQRPSGRYHARLKVERQTLQLGTFDTVEEAAAAYAKAVSVNLPHVEIAA